MTDIATLAQATIHRLREKQEQAERDGDLFRVRDAVVAIRDIETIMEEQGISLDEAA